MKRIFLGLALILCVSSFSQNTTKAITVMPNIAQGYLVLNKNVAIDHWTIAYSTKETDENGIITYNSFDKMVLYGQNYTKVPSNYYVTNEYYVTVNGYDANNIIVVEEGPIPMCNDCDPFVAVEDAVCNGTHYSFKVVRYYQDATDASHYVLKNAFTGNASSPYYYQYVSQTNSTIVDDLMTYHLPGYTVQDGLDNMTVIELDGDENTYYSVSGSPIGGAVYGIAKSLGPWNGAEGFSPDTEFFGVNSYGNDVNIVFDFYNNNGGGDLLQAAGLPLLYCNPAIGGYPEEDVDIDFWACLEEIGFELGGIDDNDVFDMINILESCADITDSDLTYNDIAFTVNDWSGNDTIINRPFGSLVGPNGEIINDDFTLKPGLYHFFFETKTGKHFSIIKEVKTTLVNSIDQKDFLTANVFPVPIVSDEFTLNLHASAKVKFKYILSDTDGNELFSKTFVLQKDHDRNHIIKPKGNQEIPTGILINTFVFEDGSIMSFQTIKN